MSGSLLSFIFSAPRVMVVGRLVSLLLTDCVITAQYCFQSGHTPMPGTMAPTFSAQTYIHRFLSYFPLGARWERTDIKMRVQSVIALR